MVDAAAASCGLSAYLIEMVNSGTERASVFHGENDNIGRRTRRLSVQTVNLRLLYQTHKG